MNSIVLHKNLSQIRLAGYKEYRFEFRVFKKYNPILSKILVSDDSNLLPSPTSKLNKHNQGSLSK